jgi:putative protein-disulfide isomerase
MNVILHYIADPLCGWCFGAAPLLAASQKVENLPIQLHLGGLFSAPNNQQVDAAMVRYIMSHHERITQLTNQTPAEKMSQLLNSGTAVLDSTPPIKACLAAEQAGGNILSYYQALIKAHFIDGLRITEEETLVQIAAECGINIDNFQNAFNVLSEAAVVKHINDSRILLQTIGGQGFPTFVLEQNGKLKMLNHQRLFNNPTGWQESLNDILIKETIQ